MLLELNQKQKSLTLFCTAACAAFVSYTLGRKLIPQTILSSFAVYLLTGDRPTIVYATIVSLPRDIRAAIKFFTFNYRIRKWDKQGKNVPTLFDETVEKYPKKTAFMMDDKKLSFFEAQKLTFQIARYFDGKGFTKGETIAVFMETRVEYACFWLGLARLGVVTALINTNLRKETLIHSITEANTKAIIVSVELAPAFAEIMNDERIKDLQIYVLKESGEIVDCLPNVEDLKQGLNAVSDEKMTKKSNEIIPNDKMVYIYTSGTTGLPKAAVITNIRYMTMAVGCEIMLDVQSNDVIYNSLPLYHSAGGMLGAGAVLIGGATMALRKKFSASNFWSDCIKYECTVAQYIGEICRFLLMTPKKPQDNQHKIRLMFGNGLRPQIWEHFVSRFGIKNVKEFYGSTEGNSNIANIDNTVGAVGFVPRPVKSIYPITLIRCDEETGEIMRNNDGLCVKCKPGEPGVFVGKIDQKKAFNKFIGYADKKASEKKVLHNVFKKGDLFFNSGDILVNDLLGNFFFKDRTGDTYRWRGENVSSSEIEAVISNVVGLKDCAVYGVDVPGCEGKAGMAAIVDPDNELNMDNLANGMKSCIPAYARPVFIRILPELPLTGTFKLIKRDLQSQGYSLIKVKDPIYFLQDNGSYKIFAEKDFDDVKNGRARL